MLISHCMNVAGKKVIFISNSSRTLEVENEIEKIVDQNPSMIAFHGTGCELLHDICDELCVGDGSNPKDIVTTWHSGETLEQVVHFVKNFRKDELGEEAVAIRF